MKKSEELVERRYLQRVNGEGVGAAVVVGQQRERQQHGQVVRRTRLRVEAAARRLLALRLRQQPAQPARRQHERGRQHGLHARQHGVARGAAGPGGARAQLPRAAAHHERRQPVHARRVVPQRRQLVAQHVQRVQRAPALHTRNATPHQNARTPNESDALKCYIRARTSLAIIKISS